MPDRVIIVAGLGRCGSSLVMQMLSAAGVPTIGSYPDFEDNLNMELPTIEAQRDFATRCPGRAMKLLDPHLHAPPIGFEYASIFLSRHPVEQAKSTLKLISARNDRQARRAMEGRIRKDAALARAAVSRIGSGRYYNMPFENLIHDPIGSAEAIASYLYQHNRPPLDAEAMARCVRRRPATCLPYLLEEHLVLEPRA